MKQGKPLKRTPLNRGTKQLGRSPLNSGSSQLKRTAFKSSNKKQFKKKTFTMSEEEKSARLIVKARSEGICEICNEREATDMAHRLARSGTGLWEPANLLHACRRCHSYNHDHPAQAYEKGQHLKQGMPPLTTPVTCYNRRVQGTWLLSNSGEAIPYPIERN